MHLDTSIFYKYLKSQQIMQFQRVMQKYFLTKSPKNRQISPIFFKLSHIQHGKTLFFTLFVSQRKFIRQVLRRPKRVPNHKMHVLPD